MPLRLLHLFLLLLLTGLADSPAWAHVRTHQYDWADRLTNFNSGAVSLVYDAEGNRVKKVANETT